MENQETKVISLIKRCVTKTKSCEQIKGKDKPVYSQIKKYSQTSLEEASSPGLGSTLEMAGLAWQPQ